MRWPFRSPENRCQAAGREHVWGRIVGEDRLGRQDEATDDVGDGCQQGRGHADPVGQDEAVEVEPFMLEDPALALQGNVVGLTADQTWAK